MKHLIILLIIILPGFVIQEFTPWWSIAAWTAVLGFFVAEKPNKCFWYGFLGGFLLWAIMAMWMYLGNGGILTNRMANMFHLGHGLVMMLVTVIIGGITAGLGMALGRVGRTLLK